MAPIPSGEEQMSDDAIESRIYLIRGQKVMLDEDLAALYKVPTKRLNEQVKRNSSRFPGDFMFQLTLQESESLKETLKDFDWGGRRKPHTLSPSTAF